MRKHNPGLLLWARALIAVAGPTGPAGGKIGGGGRGSGRTHIQRALRGPHLHEEKAMNITDGTTFYLVLGVEADPPTDIMDFDTSMALVFNSREEAVDHVHGLIGEDKTLNDYFIFQCRAVMQAKLQVQLEEIESATKP